MKLSEMNRDERSLLLFIETCCVDHGGLVDTKHINEEDNQILAQWNKRNFVVFSRITYESLKTLHGTQTHLAYLSDAAWNLAHEERRARHLRMSSKKPYCDLVTTKIKQLAMETAVPVQGMA